MKQRLLNLAAMVSMLLCVIACLLWVRSRGTFDNLCRAESRTCTNVVSVGGQLHLQFASADGPLWSHVRSWNVRPRRSVGYQSGPYTWQAVGFAKGFRTNRFGDVSTREHNIVMPYWSLVALFGILPGMCVWRARHDHVRHSRRKQGRCEGCGYDLRESPDRCPECGAPRPSST